jgi:mono/diheme cytochrome c family protein
MKKILLVLSIILIVVIVAIGGALTYVSIALPNVGEPPQLRVEATPERIERGKYLATAVTVCVDCHSTRDWSKFSGPIIPGTEGKGGERFDQTVDFPGVYYSRNITPSGISRYTDGELFRVITTGVTKEGRAMFPVMPYPHYGQMDEEDIYSLIVYLRSLPPIENEVPESTSDFPMNFILNTIPTKGTPTKRPDPADLLASGSYLANAAGCIECHTQVEQGQIIPDLAFAGGREFKFADGSIVRSSNLTPDEETGIGKWSEQAFVQRFKTYIDSSYSLPTVSKGDFNTYMPWTMYANMTEADLKAIYTYLRAVKPVKNAVRKFTAKK